MKQLSAKLIAAIAVLAIIIVAVAAIYVMTGSNSANSATYKPDHLDWFGVVVDTSGSPVGNASVTLYLMTPTGEALNVTNRTLVGTNFPGSYTFHDLPVRDDATYAYAFVDSGDLGDGVHLYGRSDNIEINRSPITPGLIVVHAPNAGNDTRTGNNSTGRVLQGWFGTVVNSSGYAITDITVTLHLMTPDGEAATNTTQTISTGQYPGSFVFDRVSLPDNVTYGYVTTESDDLGDGKLHAVRSGNYTLDNPLVKTRISSGILVLE